MTERSARLATAALFFSYVLYIRVYDIADTFLMLGEQTRDWAIALGGITELPLTGAPSTAGGRGFGPAYYWILWLGRVIAGPFADNLPHAGGFWVALLQSIADTWLLVVLWRRVGPFLALAMCLTLSSAPFDVAISSVIWNPPVAAALIKWRRPWLWASAIHRRDGRLSSRPCSRGVRYKLTSRPSSSPHRSSSLWWRRTFRSVDRGSTNLPPPRFALRRTRKACRHGRSSRVSV